MNFEEVGKKKKDYLELYKLLSLIPIVLIFLIPLIRYFGFPVAGESKWEATTIHSGGGSGYQIYYLVAGDNLSVERFFPFKGAYGSTSDFI